VTAYLVAGLVVGGVYAITAVGLTMTYVASRVFNFAHAAEAFLIAYLYYDLNTLHRWPAWAAGLACLLGVAPALGLVLFGLVFRRLSTAPVIAQLVATIGLWVAIPAVALIAFGNQQPTEVSGFFASPARIYRIAGVAVNTNQLAGLVAAAAVAVVLGVLLQGTRLGLKIRAVVDQPELAAAMGVNPSVMVAVSWVVGTVLAGLAGILLLPLLGLDQDTFTLLLVAAFAAVVIGRMRSFTWTFLGALLLGLAQNVVLKVLPSTGVLAQGVPPSIPFVLMILFVLAYGMVDRRRAGRRAGTGSGEPRRPLARAVRESPMPRTVSLGALVGFGLVLVLLPLMLPSFWLGTVASGMLLAVAVLSYPLVTGEGGMISLCQISLAGIGAIAAAQLATVEHWPVALAIVVGALIAVPVGAFVAFVSLRLDELFVGLVTLSFAVLVENLVFPANRFSEGGIGVAMAAPSIAGFSFGTNWRFYYLGLVVFALVGAVVWRIRRSTTGLALGAVRSAEDAAEMLGLDARRLRLVTFSVGAGIAGLGGGLVASNAGHATTSAFSSLTGLVWLAVAVTYGIRTITGALLAGVSFVVVPALFNAFLPTSFGNVPALLFGLGAVGVASDPRGAVAATAEHLAAAVRRLRRSAPGAAATTRSAAAAVAGATGAAGGVAGATGAAVADPAPLPPSDEAVSRLPRP
jgi:branched-chain amino acid transport system permease protein